MFRSIVGLMRSVLNPHDDWIASLVGSPSRFWLFAVFQLAGTCALVYLAAANGASSVLLLTALVALLQLSVLTALRKMYRRLHALDGGSGSNAADLAASHTST